jgi:hypothetical protein
MIYPNRLAAGDVWMGLIKHSDSDIWYEVRRNMCPSKSYTFSGQVHRERQCAVLNMSMSSLEDTDNMIYAVPCDAQTLGFACIMSMGEIPHGKL